MIETLALQCDKSRYRPVVACLNVGGWAANLERLGISVRVIQRHRAMSSRWRRFLKVGALVSRLGRLIIESHTAVVHASGNSVLVYSSLAGRLTRVGVVWHLHDSQPSVTPLRKFLLRVLAPDFLVFGNPTCVSEWLAVLGHRAPEHLIAFPGVNAADLLGGDSHRARVTLGLTSDGPVVSMFGRLAPQKGHRILVEATHRIMQTFPDANIVICTVAATPEDLRPLALLSEQLGLGRNLVLAGSVSDETRRDLLAATVVLAHPARSESFGLAMLEGMTAGKPVVAAASHGARILVEDGASGILVPPDDPGALGDAICDLLGDPQRRERFGARGRELAAKFSNEAMTQRVEEVWATVGQRSRRS